MKLLSQVLRSMIASLDPSLVIAKGCFRYCRKNSELLVATDRLRHIVLKRKPEKQ